MSARGLRSLVSLLHSGFESAGVVVGAGAYQVYQPLSCYGVGPWAGAAANTFASYEESLQLAWWDVVARLEDEATRAQAHGVVGTYVIEQRPTGGRSMMQLQLVGTAVRVPGGATPAPAVPLDAVHGRHAQAPPAGLGPVRHRGPASRQSTCTDGQPRPSSKARRSRMPRSTRPPRACGRHGSGPSSRSAGGSGRSGRGNNLAEFMAIGTAVRHREGGSWRTPAGKPFTSDLSGQDFWTLLHTGQRPVALVMGNCVYHVAHRRMLQAVSQTYQNVELPNFTQALYTARELAMERMQYEARQMSAEGVVGVQIIEKNHIWGHHAIEFFAIGTAVTRYREGGPLARPRLVLTLDN